MAQKLRKLLAATLAMSMLTGMLNLTTFAAEPEEATPKSVKIGETLVLDEADGKTSESYVNDPSDTDSVWVSFDETVATVADGVVTGVSIGETQITYTEFTPDDNDDNSYYELDPVPGGEDDANTKWLKTVTTWTVTVEAPETEYTVEGDVMTVTGPYFDRAIFEDPANQVGNTNGQGYTTYLAKMDGQEIKTLILDNPKLVTANCPDGSISAMAYIKGIEKIVVKNADTIGQNTFKGFETVTEIEITNTNHLESCSMAVSSTLNNIIIQNVGTVDFGTFAGNGAARKTSHLTLDQVDTFNDRLEVTDSEPVTVSNIKTFGGRINTTHLVLKNIEDMPVTYFNGNSIVNIVGMDMKMQSLVLENVGRVDRQLFNRHLALKTLVIDGENTVIGRFTFEKCTNLSDVTITNCAAIEGGAFESCSKLKTIEIPENTRLGYSYVPAFIENPSLIARMEDILDGQFTLKPSTVDDTVELGQDNSYMSSKVGLDNTTAVDGTQVTKSAKWTDEAEHGHTAEVKFDFRYAQDQGMDFLFVVDYSASMAMLGNEDAQNAKLYDLQSKVLDVTDELLNTSGYDNRVGIVTFDGLASSTKPGHFNALDFSNDSEALRDAFLPIRHYGQTRNTDYLRALATAKDLIDNRSDKSREAAIIFISDGAPVVDAQDRLYVHKGETLGTKHGYVGDPDWYAMLDDIRVSAQELKDQGVKIYGVMQAVSDGDFDCHLDGMNAVCTEGLLFQSTDTESFSQAVNDAIGAVFSVHTLVDVVDPKFELDERSIEVSNGSYELSVNEDGNTVITWTIYGLPYETHTMTYEAELLQDPTTGTYYIGDALETNSGNAKVYDPETPEEPINEVETPVLPHRIHDVTVNYYDIATGEKIHDSFVYEPDCEGSPYDATEQDAIEIGDYIYVTTDNDPVTGILDDDKVIDVWYRVPKDYTVTVNYYDIATNEKIHDSFFYAPAREGTAYDATEKDAIDIHGYTYVVTNHDPVKGTLDSDKIIDVWYSQIPAYFVTVNYYDEATGEKIHDSFIYDPELAGTPYDATEKDAIDIEGYTYSKTDHDPLTGILDANKVIDVWYTKNPTPTPTPDYDYFKVTVNYYDKATGEKIATSYISSPIREGKPYDVTDKDAIDIEGYTYDSTTGDPLTGTMDSDKIIDVWYVQDVEEIPEEPDVPLEELPEEEIPLIDVPETGDISALWAIVSAVSGLGLAWLSADEKKRKTF